MNMKKWLFLPITLAILLVLGTGAVLAFRYLVSAPSDDGGLVPVTITKGESVNEIATTLEQQQLIRNAIVYRLFVKLSGFETKIQAGNFKLPKNLPMKDLTYRLTRGTTDQEIRTIEGWRVEEIADYLDKKQVVSRDEFLEAAGSAKFNYDFLPTYTASLDKPYRRLEGYLFPDTYEIPAQSSAETIINVMLKNFDARVTAQMRSDTATQNLTLPQAITVASIVEREARTDVNRAKVAGILIKRFQTTGHRLETDVTEQFIAGSSPKWWGDLPDAGKNISPDNLYNTYTHDGLPPTPVDSPSLSSIKAAIYPTVTDFWFYLSGKDGVMHYAKTLEEHQANIQKYL